MSTLEMADASTPPDPMPHLPVFAFYAGGQTPHVYTDADIAKIIARHALPLWVQVETSTPAEQVAAAMLRWLDGHHWTHNTTVGIDTESAAMGPWLAELDSHVNAGGYRLMEYESKGPIPDNPETSGGRFVADWTGIPHIFPGSKATQYATASMTGLAWDSDLIDSSVPLHELHPPAVHHIGTVVVDIDMPELGPGDTGMAVRRLQGLIAAWNPAELGQAGIDGKFGPDTAAAVAHLQRIYGIGQDRGMVTARTWAVLLTG